MHSLSTLSRPAAAPDPIHSLLSADNLAKLEESMVLRTYSPGTYLFWEGDRADRLFFVRKGQVHITKTTPEGRELILHILKKDDLFAEFGGLENPVFSTNAAVIQESAIGYIRHKDLERMMTESGDFALEFMRWMGLMHSVTQSKFRDLMLYGKAGALASTLIRMANSFGKPDSAGIRISLKVTNTELANMIGTTRESVNRLLSEYRNDGILLYDEGNIVIHDLDRLKKTVSCCGCPAEICRL